MRAKLDRWLSKPSTLHFLRTLIAVENSCARKFHASMCSAHNRASTQPFRGFSALAAPQNKSGIDEQDGATSKGGEALNWSHNVKLKQTKINSEYAELGLHMSLNAGLPLIAKDISANQTFAELRFQADVSSDQKKGKLLVDDPSKNTNFKLWVEILHFRQRLDGLEGVTDVWRGLRSRGIDLPVFGEEAEILWTTIVRAALPIKAGGAGETWKSLTDLFDYAVSLKERSGLQFDGLHKCIVGNLLRSPSAQAARRAVEWSKRLYSAGLWSSNALVHLVADVASSPHRHRALYSFSAIYLFCGNRNMYDACIDEIIKADDDGAALFLHQLFLSQGDGPSTEIFSTPAVQRLFQLDNDKSLPMRASKYDRVKNIRTTESHALKSNFPPISRASMNTIVGDVHGIKPKEISDHFCARLFATRAFSVELVFRALALFGVEILGPLALRELALRSQSLELFSSKIAELKTHGISTGNNVYCQVLLKIVKEGEASLWHALLESDQHVEAYDDAVAQEALLRSFLQQRQWPQAHIALFALSAVGTHTTVRAWNMLLQNYAQQHEYQAMLNTFQSMRNQGLSLLPSSVKDIFWLVLPERGHGKRYVKGRGPGFFDPLDFVTNALIYASERGANVHPSRWKEILKRYGMDHRWNDVERLVLWLVKHYSMERSASMLGLDKHIHFHRKRVLLRTLALRNIFNSTMQQALFVWGFRSASTRRQLRPVSVAERQPGNKDTTNNTMQCEPWAQGLALLRTLSLGDRSLTVDAARKAFRQRMWVLFGPAYSTLGVNNEARLENQLSMAHYIRHANEVWDGLIDWVDPALLKHDQGNSKLLFSAFFKRTERVSSKRKEYVNIGDWLQRSQLSKPRNLYESRRTPSRQAAWERSGLRLVSPRPKTTPQEG